MRHLSTRRLLAATLLCLAMLAAPTSAHAQNCPGSKTCYYVPPQMPPPPHPVTWDLVLAAGNTAVSGTYTFPGEAPVAFTANVGAPVTIQLSSTKGLASAYATKEQRGVFVVADGPGLSVVTREITGPWNNSETVKDHNTALGTRFRVGGYTLDATQSADTGHDVIMLYAPLGATITVTPPGGIVWGDSLGSSALTFTLNAQQTYLLRTQPNGCGYDLTGALVTSDQPIAVASGGRGWGTPTCHAADPISASACGDDGFDNLIPTSGLGTQYAVDLYPGTDGDRVTVVADEDGTVVSTNGTVKTTLAAGGKYRFETTGLTLIQTSKPAYVFQDAGMMTCEQGLGIIPPLSFSTSAAIGYISFNVFGETAAVSVFLPTVNAGSVKLDGASPSGATSAVVPGTSVTRVRFPVTAGNHTVSTSGDAQLGLVSGSTSAGGTGLFAYYNRFRVPGCGDGELADNEGCDDSNVVDGDGCSGACRIELNHGVCDSDSDCVVNGRCDVGTHLCVARCTVDGDCDDTNSCTSDTCNVAAGVCTHAPQNAGTPCEDGDFCTANTACDAAGSCVGGDPVSCAQPAWGSCDEAVCSESDNMCQVRDRICTLARIYFFGVVRTGPDTLGSIRCWRDASGVSCDMEDGELVVGAPVCE